MESKTFDAEFDLDTYFKRIKYSGGARPTLKILQQIQLAHATNIPFENITPYLGNSVLLDSASLQDKLIFQKRGGYCYEQNLLLWQALEQIGFHVNGLAARPRWNTSKDTITQKSHMMLHVKNHGNDYIVDTGFGGTSPTAPLNLHTNASQPTPHEPFRITREEGIYTLQVQLSEKWKDVYEFDLQPYFLADYRMFNWYVSTYPKSRFVTNLMAAKPAPKVRYSLLNHKFSTYHVDGKTEQLRIKDFDELLEILDSIFGIQLNDVNSLAERWNPQK